MAKRALLNVDPMKRKWTYYAEEDGKTYTDTYQDVEPMIEAAKVLAEEPPDPSTGMRFMCVIPDDVMDRAMREGWLEDPKAWRKWMNENPAFTGGRSNVS